jgi:DNA polymerase-3 subunit alpha
VANAIEIEDCYNKIKKEHPDFKVIRGNEIYLVRNGLNADNFDRTNDKYYHFILLAKDAEGHRQIRELSTRAWMRSYTSGRMVRVPTYYQDLIDIIGANPGHVIGSTACIGGALPSQLLRFRNLGDQRIYESCIRWCQGMIGIFGEGNFFLEMQPSFNKDQIYVNKELIKISNKLNIPYIITCDAHYQTKEDAPVHAAFLRSQEGEREVEEFYATTYLMSDEEIRNYMEESLGAEVLETAYENIRKIKDMCEDYTLKKPLVIPKLMWKTPVKEVTSEDREVWSNRIPYLKTFLNSTYKEDILLAENIIDRLKIDEELQNNETYEEINACLEDTWVSSEVNNARWSAYFLNLQKIVEVCWDAGSLVGCGRGSGVGFILLYILGITQINPLKEKTSTFRWRFLNPARVSVLDVDVDIESTKRADVLNKLREVYGEDRVANVLTLGTEQSKSAIQTAARGLGIDVDVARYLSSMIESDRGKTRTLKQTFYGDPDNDMKPNKQFVYEMTNNYPELWRVAQKIEGLICRTGEHAGGVIFVDEPFTESTALMRTPSGDIITQFDLHKAEDASLIKYDLLSVEALDKIHICLNLLEEHGLIEGDNLKDKYEKTIGIYTLEREAHDMWEMCWEHKVLSLFQMEKQSGIKGIALLKPNSVDELAILNSTIRLMATEKGGEMPTEKLTRFKNNPKLWDIELEKYGLGPPEKKVLEPVVGISYGLCITQEQFMQLVQLPELGGFDLTFADRLRKSIAKKNPADYEKLTKEYFEECEKKGCNMNLCHYVWDVLIAMSRGYGFNALLWRVHT